MKHDADALHIPHTLVETIFMLIKASVELPQKNCL